jgi:hypothetical protein
MAKDSGSVTATDLEELIRRLNPNVPAGQSETAMRRIPRDSNAMRQLRTHVAADPYAKVLLTGHIGVGKSTELLHLAHEMGTSRFVIQCSIASTLGVHNLGTFSLLVVILDACIRSWIERLGEMPPGLIEELVDHIRNLLPNEKRPAKKTKGLPPIFLDAAAAAAFAKVVDQLLTSPRTKHASDSEQLAALYSDILQRLALRYIPNDQLAALDVTSVARSCEIVLKEIAHKAEKAVLLVIDDLDKLRDEEVQAEVFVERAMAWMRLPCGVVATLPLDAMFSAKGRELDEVWGTVQILDPLPVPALDGPSAGDPDLQDYLTMVRAVDGQRVISALQCRRLAHLASGLPRSFVYSCGACVRYCLEAGDSHVRDYHVDLVQRDLTDRWRGRLIDADYVAMIKVLDSGGSNVPEAIKLLRDGLLIRDGNASPDSQFRLATWIVPLVEAYRKRLGA